MSAVFLVRTAGEDFLNHVVTAPIIVADRSRRRLRQAVMMTGGSPMEGAMKKVLITSGALVVLIAGGPAMAAEIGVGAPPPAYALVNDWSGFYVGGHTGYGWGHDPFTSSLGGQQAGSLASSPSMFRR